MTKRLTFILLLSSFIFGACATSVSTNATNKNTADANSVVFNFWSNRGNRDCYNEPKDCTWKAGSNYIPNQSYPREQKPKELTLGTLAFARNVPSYENRLYFTPKEGIALSSAKAKISVRYVWYYYEKVDGYSEGFSIKKIQLTGRYDSGKEYDLSYPRFESDLSSSPLGAFDEALSSQWKVESYPDGERMTLTLDLQQWADHRGDDPEAREGASDYIKHPAGIFIPQLALNNTRLFCDANNIPERRYRSSMSTVSYGMAIYDVRVELLN